MIFPLSQARAALCRPRLSPLRFPMRRHPPRGLPSLPASGNGDACDVRPGTLYVVATPIGNLGDVTKRAAEALSRVSVVACEDTRRTGVLLQHLGIRNKLLSFHVFNERDRCPAVVDRLIQGQDVALVSDAGTPGISDPGNGLVGACLARGITVTPIPGPSALSTALSVSHISVERFLFAGFLPSRRGERRKAVAEMAACPHALVLYEAPHRATACIEDLLDILGNRGALLCRELTKLHEEVRPGNLSGLLDELRSREKVLGEIVLVVEGSPRNGAAGGAAPGDSAVEEAFGTLREKGISLRDSADLLSKLLSIPRKQLYSKMLEWEEHRLPPG